MLAWHSQEVFVVLIKHLLYAIQVVEGVTLICGVADLGNIVHFLSS
jgi:hypothetical protein